MSETTSDDVIEAPGTGTFNPNKYVIKVQGGRRYLPIEPRIHWFRSKYPLWGITTEALQIDAQNKFAIFCARICDETGRVVSMGTKMEDAKGFSDYLEKAEKGAIGRALGVLGFGTPDDPDEDERDRLADAPKGRGAAQSHQSNTRTASQSYAPAQDPRAAFREAADSKGMDVVSLDTKGIALWDDYKIDVACRRVLGLAPDAALNAKNYADAVKKI